MRGPVFVLGLLCVIGCDAASADNTSTVEAAQSAPGCQKGWTCTLRASESFLAPLYRCSVLPSDDPFLGPQSRCGAVTVVSSGHTYEDEARQAVLGKQDEAVRQACEARHVVFGLPERDCEVFVPHADPKKEYYKPGRWIRETTNDWVELVGESIECSEVTGTVAE